MADDDNVDLDDDSKVTGPLGVLFPPETAVWNEARKLASDANVRVETLATTAVQDPVLVMELLKVANALYFAGGRNAITSPTTAIVRLGSEVVLETLEKLSDRQPFTNPDVAKWFEKHRSRSKRVGIVSRILAEAVARNLSDDCQAAGSLVAIGDMLAVAYFGEEYVKLAEEHARSGVNYRLNQTMQFDVDKMGLSYLRRMGIPEVLLFAIDRESRARAPERAVMKPLCLSASELVDAFDANRWEKLAPGKRLPPKSSIRLLQINDSQYLKIYERTSEYLFSAKMLEERARHQPAQSIDGDSINVSTGDNSAFDAEIQDLIQQSGADDLEEPIVKDVEEVPSEQTEITELEGPLGDLDEQFSFTASKNRASKSGPRETEKVKVVEPPKLRTNKGNEFVSSISNLFEDADSSEELLAQLLQMLVDGPYEKSALIVVSKDRKQAIVVAARGPNIGNGQKIELHDPLSPLAQCFSKVQSFSNKINEASPFGCKSFALAPIDADHDTPVALYADCGNDGALSFEARRVFRTVVDLLNQKLPSIPGGIPVELSESTNV